MHITLKILREEEKKKYKEEVVVKKATYKANKAQKMVKKVLQ